MTTRTFLVLIPLAAGIAEAQAVVLFNNLSEAGESVAAFNSTIHGAQRIAPLSQPYTLTSVTLLIGENFAGFARVSIFSGDAETPIALVGNLTSPGSISSTLSENTFTTPGISLDSGVNYWVVLAADSGLFAWSYTSSNGGEGEGLTTNWANFNGTSWEGGDLIHSTSPYQMSVQATAVPELSSTALQASLALGAVAVAHRLRKQRRQ
jgi:hypothetical protein